MLSGNPIMRMFTAQMRSFGNDMNRTNPDLLDVATDPCKGPLLLVVSLKLDFAFDDASCSTRQSEI